MQSRLTFLALIGLLSIVGTSLVFAARIDTPTTAVECQPLSLKWHEADPRGLVYISAIEGKDISAQPLIQFQPQQGIAEGTFLWDQVNVTAGTTITFIINDASGSVSYSGQTTIQKGPRSGTCNAVGSGSSGGGSSGSTGTKPPSTTPPTSGSTTPTNSGSTAPSGGNSSGANPASTTNTTAPSKPSSGTSGATVNTHVQSVAVASIAIVLGSILAFNIL